MNGWKCPECGRVFAPHVDECKYCGKYTVTTPQPIPEVPSPTIPFPSIPYPYRENWDWWRKPLVTWATKTISTDGTLPPLTILY